MYFVKFVIVVLLSISVHAAFPPAALIAETWEQPLHFVPSGELQHSDLPRVLNINKIQLTFALFSVHSAALSSTCNITGDKPLSGNAMLETVKGNPDCGSLSTPSDCDVTCQYYTEPDKSLRVIAQPDTYYKYGLVLRTDYRGTIRKSIRPFLVVSRCEISHDLEHNDSCGKIAEYVANY